MKLSIRGKHGNHNSKKYRRTYRRNNNRNKRTQYVSHGGSGSVSQKVQLNEQCNVVHKFQRKLSYSKGILPRDTSNFNITLLKQPSSDEKPNELKFRLLMQRLSKKNYVDKTFTVYFTVIFVTTYTGNPPCNTCYAIYYSQDTDGHDRNKQRLDITYQLNYVEKSSINNDTNTIFAVKNDTFDPKEAYTYNFNCNDQINKKFFVELVNILNKCIIDKYNIRRHSNGFDTK